jgi:hypothetical protein
VNSSFRPHLDIFPSPQSRLWPHLRPLLSLGFVLYGGTAAALRLGHRISVDFDFFNDRPLDKAAVMKAFTDLRSEVLQDHPDTLTLLVWPSDGKEETVKISCFGSLHFGRVGDPQKTEDGVACIASLTDLLGHKLKVLLQRIESKDYLDIVALLKAGVPLESGLAAARALFGSAFQPAESLKALVYFEGGDLSKLTPELREFLIRASSQVTALPETRIVSSSLSVVTQA